MNELLERLIRNEWPDATTVEVTDVAVLAGGYSRQTFRFNCVIERTDGRRELPMILRKDPPPAAAILETNRELEMRLIRAVATNTKIPVSECYFLVDSSVMGEAAMVIERVHGHGEPSRLFNGGPDEAMADGVATDLCEYLAELHMTDPAKLDPQGRHADPRGVGIDVSSWDQYMASTFEYYIRGYDQVAFDPMPGWLDGLLYIRRNVPRPLPLRLLHGDFNPANFLYENGRVTAIIDWENSHIGDPREDLGWLKHMDVLSNTNIFGSVSADGGFLQHYNRITGFDVTEKEVEYFRLFSSANIGVPIVSALKRRLDDEHTEFLHLYLLQPVIGSFMATAGLMNYPMVPEGV